MFHVGSQLFGWPVRAAAKSARPVKAPSLLEFSSLLEGAGAGNQSKQAAFLFGS